MLTIFRNSKLSTDIGKIEELDFTQIYKSIAEIYDFFDIEYSKT